MATRKQQQLKADNKADLDKREAFLLRLNGRVVPWAIVVFLVVVVGRALVAEWRIQDLESDRRDHEERIRRMEPFFPRVHVPLRHDED